MLAWSDPNETTLIREGIEQGIKMMVMINNLAGGNAPRIAQEIVARLRLEKPQRPFFARQLT
jgi:hypothetical protein